MNRQLHILYVEDSVVNQCVVKSPLESDGHAVTCVDTGAEALKSVKHNIYDIILMDLELPDIHGEKVLAHIRAQGVTTPVIAVSAHDITNDYAGPGFADYICKPVSMDRLRTIISTHCV